MMIKTLPIMVQPQTSHLLDIIEEVSDNVDNYNNLTRDISKRETLIGQIDEVIALCKKYKEDVQESDAPAICANRILSIQLVLECWKYELQMWNALRNEDWDDGWAELVHAELAAQRAVQANILGEKIGMRNYHKRLLLIQQILYPKALFTSPGMKTGTAICSICEEEYHECHHIKNRAYNGEMCITELRDIKEIDHIALVEEPANKLQRIGSFE